jgi:uncharacterized protein (TIRG00374 family)
MRLPDGGQGPGGERVSPPERRDPPPAARSSLHGGGLWVGTLLSVACLAFFAWNAQWADIGRALAEVRSLDVLLAAACILSSLVGRAWRWKVLLGTELPTSFRHRLTATAIGFMGNNVFPGRLGEPLRCFALSRLEPRVTFSAAIGTAVVDRVFDLVATLVALAIFLLLSPAALEDAVSDGDLLAKIRAVAWVFAAGLAVAFGVLFVVAHRPDRSRALAIGVLRFLPRPVSDKAAGIVEAFTAGLTSLRSLRAIGMSLFFTSFIWLAILFNAFYMLRALGLDHLGVVHALGVMVVLCFAVALPQAPGYLGVFQIASEKTLTGLFGVATPVAQAFAIALWASQVIPVVGAGVVALWIEGFSPSEVRRIEPAGPATPLS